MEARAAGGVEGVVAPVAGEGWRLEGELGLDGAWTLDPYLDREVGVTATGELLERSWVRPMSRPTAALGVRMAALLGSRTWPADLVVVPVPSSNDAADVLSRVVALVLEREAQRLLVARRGMRQAAPEHRYRLARRRVPDHVLLVDDVVRTGASLRACAEMLRLRGAIGVWAVTATAELVPADRRAGARRRVAGDLDLPDTMLARVEALRPATPRGVDVAAATSFEVGARVPLFDQESPEPDTAVDDRTLPIDETGADATPSDDLEGVDPDGIDPDGADAETVDAATEDVAGMDVAGMDVASVDVLDDEELMAAVGRAFEAIAGLEALQKIVEQVPQDESVSIEDLLSELLAAGAVADVAADGGEDVPVVDESGTADDTADTADESDEVVEPEVADESDVTDTADESDESDESDTADESDEVVESDDAEVTDEAEVVDEADVTDTADESDDVESTDMTRVAVTPEVTDAVDAAEETEVADGDSERGDEAAEQQAARNAAQVAGWRGRRRRQKPRPSTMR